MKEIKTKYQQDTCMFCRMTENLVLKYKTFTATFYWNSNEINRHAILHNSAKNDVTGTHYAASS